MRPRAQFWWSALKTGLKREWDVSGHFLRALGLLALAGGSIGGGFLVGRPVAVVIAVVVVLLVGAFAEGTYQKWRAAEDARVEAAGASERERSARAAAARLRGFVHEFELMRAEAPAADAPLVTRTTYVDEVNDIRMRATREIRLSAPDKLPEWQGDDPDDLPDEMPDRAHVWIDWTIGQLEAFIEDLESR